MEQQGLFRAWEEEAQSDPQAAIADLSALIKGYDRAYYQENESPISDAKYDLLKRRLQELESEYPQFVLPDSPTQSVGGAGAATFAKVTHSVPMLSMANALNFQELDDFEARVRRVLPLPTPVQYVVELKIDGLALSLIYKERRLVLAATRGNGEVGEDVTANALQIADIPRQLPAEAPDYLEVRGEVYMARSVFQEINSTLPPGAQKANPRNLAAGSLRQKDPQMVKERRLNFFAYYVINPVPGVESQSQALAYLRRLGFSVASSLPPGFKGDPNPLCASMEEARRYCEAWTGPNRQKLDFNIDGLVVKVDSFAQQRQLGVNVTSPNWAMAYKFPPQEVESVVEDIIYQVGRTGAITPVAVLRPVQIEGTTVSRASLHNIQYIRNLGLRVGDRVKVYKAAAIIPQIASVIGAYTWPTRCPSCQQVLQHSADYKDTRCLNPDCPERVERALLHFCSRDAMNIEGLGVKIIHNLVCDLGVRHFSQLYALSLEELSQAANSTILGGEIKAEIERSRQRPLANLLFALGIEEVGLVAAINLAGHFKSLDNLRESVLADPQVLESIPYLGGKETIPAYFANPQVQEELEALRQAGLNFQDRQEGEGSSKLAGLTVVLTGTLDGLSRTQASQLLRSHGAKVTSSVTSKTDYLIVGTKPGHNKLADAQKYKVPLLNQSQLRELLEAPQALESQSAPPQGETSDLFTNSSADKGEVHA